MKEPGPLPPDELPPQNEEAMLAQVDRNQARDERRGLRVEDEPFTQSRDPRAATIIERADIVICRPPVGQHVSSLGDVVIGNWLGRVDGKNVRVVHGTPVRGLPDFLVRRIAQTEGQRVGPYPPPAA